MILLIDASEHDRVLLGLADNTKLRAVFVPTHGSSFDLLGLVVQFLQRHRYTLSNVRTLIAAEGPGRFGGLRLTSVLANTMHWSESIKIETVRGKGRGETAVERVAYMRGHAARTRMAKPFYGKPPSITKPKKP